jgi:hypothetical protein
MRKTFIECGVIVGRVDQYVSNEQLSYLPRELLNDPETGAVMPGCGAWRKIGVADTWRGTTTPTELG